MNTIRRLLLGSVVVLAGCAGNAPRPDFHQRIAAEEKLISRDTVRSSVVAAEGVSVSPQERDRLAHAIQRQIAEAGYEGNRPARDYQISVTLTRYDKGHAGARFMLAGLGQMHIEGRVTVQRQPGRRQVADFTARKTFAWGGIYGAVTTMATVENTFAEIIAEAVCE